MALWVLPAGVWLGASLLLVAFPAIVFLCVSQSRRKEYERVPSPAARRKGGPSTPPQSAKPAGYVSPTVPLTPPTKNQQSAKPAGSVSPTVPLKPPSKSQQSAKLSGSVSPTVPLKPPTKSQRRASGETAIPPHTAGVVGSGKPGSPKHLPVEQRAANHTHAVESSCTQTPTEPTFQALHQSSADTEVDHRKTTVDPVSLMEEGRSPKLVTAAAAQREKPALTGQGASAETTTVEEKSVPEPVVPWSHVPVEQNSTEPTKEASTTKGAVLENGVVPSNSSEAPAPVKQVSTEVDATVPKLRPAVAALIKEGRLPLGSRKTISLADARDHTFSRSIDEEAVELSEVLQEDGEELDDTKDMKAFRSHLRSRTKTISGLGQHVEAGRRTSRDLRREAMRNKTEKPSTFTGSQREGRMELELLSPEMEAKIQEITRHAIGRKYGGTRRSTRAATTIQRAYRDFKLHEKFKEIQREKQEMTLRTSSVKGGHRPSILRRKQAGDGFQRKHRQVEGAHRVATPTDQKPMDQSDCVAPVEKELEPRRRENDDEEIFVEGPSLASIQDTEMESGLEASTFPLVEEQSMSRARRGRVVSVFTKGQFFSVQIHGREKLSVPRRRTVSAPAIARRKLMVGINHFNRKPTRGIQYLVMQGMLEDDPQAVAEFLMKSKGLSKEKIGEFLGEINVEFNMAVLKCLTEMVSVESKTIDEALRQFLLIFRMPGEAQKIDKIMQAFALEYYKQNKDGPVKSEDAAYILAFAIMMLHTSLHNPSVRSKTTREQWLTITKGCNEGENFPRPFLMEIYNRIQKTEFTTGHDHTKEVAEIEKLITGPNAPKLAVPQRRFICRVQVSEVKGLGSRSNFKRHRRTIFIFSDIVVVCKKKGAEQFHYRQLISLLSTVPVHFETQHYKHGVQFYSSLDKKALFQCNCDSHDDHQLLLRKLTETTKELKELERERMAELSTSVTNVKAWEGLRAHMLAGVNEAGDLLSSTEGPAPEASEGEFSSRAGDLAVSTSLPARRRTVKEAPRAPFLTQKRRPRNKDGRPLLGAPGDLEN